MKGSLRPIRRLYKASAITGAINNSPRDTIPPQRKGLVAVAALCGIALLAYSNSFHGGFVLDCNQLLLHDPRIQKVSAANFDQILHRTYWWPYGESGLYRPLATLSYLFNYSVLGNGESPAGYHWVNFLLHLTNVLLVYALGLRLMNSRRLAFATAALWSVHPVLTESVSYMVGRPELLAGAGVLGGFLLYLIGTESSGVRRWAALVGAAVAAGIGVFSKESAVTLIGLIALYELAWWKQRRHVRRRIIGSIAIAVPIAAMLVLRAQVLAASPPARFPFLDNPLVNAGFIEGKLTALAVTASYLWRLVSPITLSADYSWAQIPTFHGTPAEWLSILAVTAVAAAVVWSWRVNRTIFFFAAFAAVTFLPGSNLLFPIGTLMAERLLYLPAIGFCACLVVLLASNRFGPAIAALLLVGYGLRTWERNIDWSDNMHMAQAMVETSPDSFKTQKTLAFLLFHADESHGNLRDVIAHAEKGIAVLDPVSNVDNDAESYRFAGNYHFFKGDFPRASELFKRSLAIMMWNGEPDANAGFALRQLAITYLRMNEPENAAQTAFGAVQADPLNPERYLQMAEVMTTSNQREMAVVTLLQGSALIPDKRFEDALRHVDPDGSSASHLQCPALANAIKIRKELRDIAIRQYGCPTNALDPPHH